MALSDVKKELKKLEKEKLIELIAELYKKHTSVKAYLDFYANPDEQALFNAYRDKVYAAFFPKRGYQLRLSHGKKAINDFKKHGTSPDLLAELMLFYTETGIQFTKKYGAIDQPFYSSLETTYSAALTLLKKENVLEPFTTRVWKIVDSTSNTHWGFHEHLVFVYFNFYEELPPEFASRKNSPT